MPHQGLIDAVVDGLVDEVMESPRPGIADVHGGPFADGLKSLKNLDR